MIEIDKIPCAECGELIDTYWDNGLISRPEYVLVADWVFHTECWNAKVDANPP